MSDNKNELDLPVLELNTALNILIQGVQIAQKQGIYNFQDSASIYQAISSIQHLARQSEARQRSSQAAKPVQPGNPVDSDNVKVV